MKWIVIILFSELCKIDVPYAIRTWRELWILQAFRTLAGKDHEKKKDFNNISFDKRVLYPISAQHTWFLA